MSLLLSHLESLGSASAACAVITDLVISSQAQGLTRENGVTGRDLDTRMQVGWKHQEAVAGLEAARKERAGAYYEAKRKLQKLQKQRRISQDSLNSG